MADPLRIVSIGAHPADVFDHSGGTMAHHTTQGDYVACIVLTHGARVHDAVISEEMHHRSEIPNADELSTLMTERSEAKAEEVRAACRILGVEDVIFLGLDDAVLLVTDETVRRLARLLREIKPDIILTHFPKVGDGLNAHAVCGQIVHHAMSLASSVDPGDRHPPHRVARTFYYGSAAQTRGSMWDAEGGYYNNVFIETTDVIDKKLATLNSLVSQGYSGAYARKRIEVSDGTFGKVAGCPYAEAFIAPGHDVHHLLPVTDRQLTRARASDFEIIAEMSHRVEVD
jgi:LmbE family N-acetylglucosaminyl deacetylase